MYKSWAKNIKLNKDLIGNNLGAKKVVVVSGSELDRLFWEERFNYTKNDVFRRKNRRFHMK